MVGVGEGGVYVAINLYYCLYSAGTLILTEDLTKRKGFYIPLKFVCLSCGNKTDLPMSTKFLYGTEEYQLVETGLPLL